MRKDILKYLFILTIAVIVSIIIYFHFEDRNVQINKKYIYDRKEYKNINVDDIEEIEISPSNEIVMNSIIINDKDKIKSVFKKLGEIWIENETDLRGMDDEYSVVIKTNDATIGYYFEGNILHIDNKYYEVDGLYKLKHLVSQ